MLHEARKLRHAPAIESLLAHTLVINELLQARLAQASLLPMPAPWHAYSVKPEYVPSSGWKIVRPFLEGLPHPSKHQDNHQNCQLLLAF